MLLRLIRQKTRTQMSGIQIITFDKGVFKNYQIFGLCLYKQSIITHLTFGTLKKFPFILNGVVMTLWFYAPKGGSVGKHFDFYDVF